VRISYDLYFAARTPEREQRSGNNVHHSGIGQVSDGDSNFALKSDLDCGAEITGWRRV
jgi:hypothetical protein